MAVRTSCTGKVSFKGVDIADVRRWTFDWDAELKEFSSSSTNCKKVNLTGAETFTGEFDVYINDTSRFEDTATLKDTGALKLYEDANDFWNIVDVIINNITVEAPIEDGDPSIATLSFALTGTAPTITPPA